MREKYALLRLSRAIPTRRAAAIKLDRDITDVSSSSFQAIRERAAPPGRDINFARAVAAASQFRISSTPENIAIRRDIAGALRAAIGAIQTVFRVKRIANANTASRARHYFTSPFRNRPLVWASRRRESSSSCFFLLLHSSVHPSILSFALAALHEILMPFVIN